MATTPGADIVTGRELGTVLCKLFGLDPNYVGSITIHLDPNDVVRMEIERFPRRLEIDRALTLAEREHWGLHRLPKPRDLGPGYKIVINQKESGNAETE